MRFSVFLNARSMSPAEDRRLIQDLMAHVDLADQLHFDAIFIPDHHFTGYMPIASDPFLFAAYLAATHKRMHFGFSVTSVPLHSPIRLVERINILDQLTDGKILVGVGSGTTAEEMIGFGVNHKEASKVAEENLAIAEQLWAKTPTSETVKFDTGHYKGEVLQRIAPAPFTPGHARLMPVAFRESSARRAAENGWPTFIPAFTPPNIGGLDPMFHVKKYFEIYRNLLLAAGHSPERVADALSWTTHSYQCVHLAPTDEQAREEMMTILRAYQAAVDREAVFNVRAEEKSAENKKIDQTPNALTEEWIATWCLYGSPETVTRHLKEYEELGIGNILCGTTTGPLTPERLRLGNQTLHLLSTEVMPHFAATKA